MEAGRKKRGNAIAGSKVVSGKRSEGIEGERREVAEGSSVTVSYCSSMCHWREGYLPKACTSSGHGWKRKRKTGFCSSSLRIGSVAVA